MSHPILTPAPRLRRTPFSNRVEAAGVKAYTVYNHMLLASFFRSPEEDYQHLKTAVQVWDVSSERQVEIKGPDAEVLVQMSTPRDMSRMKDDQCYYIPNVDARGMMMNDPVANKLAKDRFWISIADSDMLYYYRGLATGLNLSVEIFEPDVSPLAIQGPKSDELVRRVFGQDIVDTKFFRHKTITFQGQDMIIARSGWSLQGGFEIYVDGSENGEPLWDLLFEAGEDLDVHAGCPNLIERIEGGLLSWGSDFTNENTPFEAGLGKYCHLITATGCLGIDALRNLQNPERMVRPVEVSGPALLSDGDRWQIEDGNGQFAGRMSSLTWSNAQQTNIAVAMIEKDYWDEGTSLVIQTPQGPRDLLVREKYWS